MGIGQFSISGRKLEVAYRNFEAHDADSLLDNADIIMIADSDRHLYDEALSSIDAKVIVEENSLKYRRYIDLMKKAISEVIDFIQEKEALEHTCHQKIVEMVSEFQQSSVTKIGLKHHEFFKEVIRSCIKPLMDMAQKTKEMTDNGYRTLMTNCSKIHEMFFTTLIQEAEKASKQNKSVIIITSLEHVQPNLLEFSKSFEKLFSESYLKMGQNACRKIIVLTPDNDQSQEQSSQLIRTITNHRESRLLRDEQQKNLFKNSQKMNQRLHNVFATLQLR